MEHLEGLPQISCVLASPLHVILIKLVTRRGLITSGKCFSYSFVCWNVCCFLSSRMPLEVAMHLTNYMCTSNIKWLYGGRNTMQFSFFSALSPQLPMCRAVWDTKNFIGCTFVDFFGSHRGSRRFREWHEERFVSILLMLVGIKWN